MAWNKPENKGFQSDPKVLQIGPGAPTAWSAGARGQPYHDGWSIERAYSEGFQRVTWVMRCIEVIAGNQARLPVILRKSNDPDGEIIKGGNQELLQLLNTKANKGENSFQFRMRVSSQLLMSSRGVFIEKVYSRGGKLLALNILPPQSTSPIPDPVNFVSGFEVRMPNGQPIILPPDRVLWIRKPHPLDPYLSVTPMEAAGIAIEIENLAKAYNRNFLQADGRPGLLLVARGEVNPDDREELQARFRGGPSRAGRTTIIGSDDGIDVIDTSASPRDAAYTEMRSITKEEILAAFGVPESALANASGRTFTNASEEMRVFWMETMLPHLDLLARSFDELDEKNYVDFDVSEVPILILLKQERDRFLMEETDKGLTSVNEYRVATGKKETESELADQLLYDPNKTPIANTTKKFVPQPVETPSPVAQPIPPEGAIPVDAPAEEVPTELPNITASYSTSELATKSAEDVSIERWSTILGLALERVFKDQEKAVTSMISGKKTALNVDKVFSLEDWNKKLDSEVRPVVRGIIQAGAQANGLKDAALVDSDVDAQVERIKSTNTTTKKELGALLVSLAALSEADRSDMAKVAVPAIFAPLLGSKLLSISNSESQAAWNGGVFLAAQNSVPKVNPPLQGDSLKPKPTTPDGESESLTPRVGKTWISRRDSKVRSTHVRLDGTTVAVSDPFVLNGVSAIRYPGDPLAPLALTVGCRCKLGLSKL